MWTSAIFSMLVNTTVSFSTVEGEEPGGNWEKDVGVIINEDLKPSLQCAMAALKANQVLGQISRGVCFRDKDNFL